MSCGRFLINAGFNLMICSRLGLVLTVPPGFESNLSFFRFFSLFCLPHQNLHFSSFDTVRDTLVSQQEPEYEFLKTFDAPQSQTFSNRRQKASFPANACFQERIHSFSKANFGKTTIILLLFLCMGLTLVYNLTKRHISY